MSWISTLILHEPRKLLKITITEYCILDVIYNSQTSPIYSVDGWAKNGCHQIADFLDLSPSTVLEAFKRMEKMGYLEFDETRKLKKTTIDFYSVAYEKRKDILAEKTGCSESKRAEKLNYAVRKPNGWCSVPEQGGVREPNENYSETEHKIKEIEFLNRIKAEVGQSPTTHFDQVDEIGEVDEETVMILSLPDSEKKEKVAPKRKKTSEPTHEELDLIFDVITYLNQKTGQSFQASASKNQTLIYSRARAEKWTLEDFKIVIDHKHFQWGKDPKMAEYLRPSTLFAAGHAEEYLQAAKNWDTKKVVPMPGTSRLYRQEITTGFDPAKAQF